MRKNVNSRTESKVKKKCLNDDENLITLDTMKALELQPVAEKNISGVLKEQC